MYDPSRHQRKIKALADVLSMTRQRKKLSIGQLAKRLGKAELFVTNYESCKYRLDLVELVDITDALGVDVVELINLYQQAI